MDTLRQEASVDPAEEITKIVDGWIMKIHNAIFNKEIVKPALASEKRGSINSRLFDEVPAPISRSSTLLLNDVLSQRKLSDSSDSSNPSSVDDDDDDDDAEDDYNKEDKDPFRLYYKPRSTGWLVRFMHSLALNEEGILKKKEVDKIVDLRSKYARAEFAANTETTLALSTLQAEVVEYLSDLEIKIHHRKSDHPRLSLLNSRNSMTFVRQPVVSLKGRILDLFTAERRRTRNIQHRHAYASFWHMYRISEQSKYLIPRGNGKRKSMDNKSAAPKNHSDDAKRTTAKPQLKVLRMLSMRNWPLEAHTAQPLPSNPNCLTNAPTTTTTQECCDVSIEEDDTLSLANSRMMHVCEDYPNGREIEKMPLGVKRKLHDKGLLGSQLWTKMMDSQSEATGRRAKTYSKLFTNTITNDVESALPAIFDKMGRHLMPSKSDIPHSVTRSASTGALEMSSPRRDPSRWKEFTTVAPRIDISLEKSVTQEFKYPGCVAFFEAVKDRGIPPTPLPILAGTQEINDLVLSYRGLSDQELEAVVTGAVEIRSQPLKRLVLSGNSITDRGFLFLLDRFEHAGWLDVVESIDLGDNSGIGTDTIRAIGRLLHSNLVPRLMILKLSDITITDYAYALLSQQLHNETIEELDLSYTGLGRWSIQGPICVAEMIVHLKNLKSLNISGNHLNHSAMVHIGTALTKAGKLTSLSCSNNSGQLSHSFGSHFARSGYLGKAGMVALEDSVGREALDRCFPCMNILCSYLGSIPTLEYVDLCNSQLNHQSAFVLADSLCFHLNIRTLILSNNPMGPDGIRALLKIMYLNPFPSDRKMHSIALDRCEDSTMDDTALGGSVGGSPDGGAEYNFLDPTGSYRLHVENPYYRAVVRQCLRRWQLIQDSTSFSETFYDIRHNGSPIASFELDDKNVWHLPTQGMLTYTAVYRQKASEAALDPGTLNDDLGRAARETLSDDLFQRLIRCYMSCGQDTSRRPIIKALSKDFVLTASQVTMLFHATVNGEFKIPLLKSLMDNIADPANALFLVEYLSKSTILTKHPTNYSTSASPISKKTLVKGKVKPTDFKLYFTYSGSNPTGHYKLDLRIPDHYMVAEHLILTNRWDVEWCKAKGRPDVSQYGNYQCFRNEHYDGMPFKYGRDWTLPTSGIWEFDYVSPRRAPKGAVPITAEAWLRVTQSIQNALDEGRLSNEVIVMCLRRVSHLFYVNCSQIDVLLAMFPQTSQNLQIRRDIFTTLYNRIVDYVDIREHFCRPRLGLPPAFGPACIAILERQIGMLNLFNPLKADNAAFKCDFNSHEGRLMAQIILRLKKTEDNRIINSRFGASLEVILPMDAPPAWYQCVPFEGYWEGTYVGTNSKMNVRKDIAMTYCAYEF